MSTPGSCAGRTLVEIIRDKLDEAYIAWWEWDEKRSNMTYGYAEGHAKGIAHALGILRGTSEQHEMDEAEERYEP